jgi:hypothetical protein
MCRDKVERSPNRLLSGYPCRPTIKGEKDMSFTERYYKRQFEKLAEGILSEMRIIEKTNLNNINARVEMLLKELGDNDDDVIYQIKEAAVGIKEEVEKIEADLNIFKYKVENEKREIKKLKGTDW